MDREQVVGGEPAGPKVVALDPGRLLIQVDREVSAIDAAIRESRASKTFRRAWREFVAAWRAHFREEALHPSPEGGRQTLMFRRRAQEWRRSWQVEHAGDVGWDPEVGSFIVTPGAIKAEMETVKTGVNQLDADIMSSKVRDAFKQAWRAFVAEWNTFYKDNQGWWARGFGKTYTKTVDFRRRVDEWRAAFLKEGGATTGPVLTPSEPAGGSSWKTAIIAGGALLVAGALISKAASR